jgi:3-hexulose-6-phosphate synthase/6-phospho-3-hexuloisomerase
MSSRLKDLSYPVVQVSLDLTSMEEAIETASTAVEAGVDWLEAGTPLLLSQGLKSVSRLRERFPNHPIVADLKTMDGGYHEAKMMAKAGADLVVVMGRAHEATIRATVQAGHDCGVKVMGDNMVAEDKAGNARWMEDLGVDFIIHHVGYDERRLIQGISPMDELEAVVRAVDIPVQAVGGLTIQQAIDCPRRGAPLVVIGAPLVIDNDGFRPSSEDLKTVLTEITVAIRKTPYIRPT